METSLLHQYLQSQGTFRSIVSHYLIKYLIMAGNFIRNELRSGIVMRNEQINTAPPEVGELVAERADESVSAASPGRRAGDFSVAIERDGEPAVSSSMASSTCTRLPPTTSRSSVNAEAATASSASTVPAKVYEHVLSGPRFWSKAGHAVDPAGSSSSAETLRLLVSEPAPACAGRPAARPRRAADADDRVRGDGLRSPPRNQATARRTKKQRRTHGK